MNSRNRLENFISSTGGIGHDAARAKDAENRLYASSSRTSAHTMQGDVGKRLKFLRESLGLSQREMAKRSNLTHRTIGLIERDEISPSVGSLLQILSSFSMSMSDFFALDPHDDELVFFKRDELYEIGTDAISVLQVGRNLKKHALQVLMERYPPGTETTFTPVAHRGSEEGGIVIQGEIEATVGRRTQVLKQFDAFLFMSNVPHRFRNAGTEECIIISAATPPI